MEDRTPLLQLAAAQAKLDQARWASTLFDQYNFATVQKIVNAVAEAGYQNARRFAEMSVDECGFGVVDDKEAKNRTASRGFIHEYGSRDLCTTQIDIEGRQVRFPDRPG
ncbi:hypothetical protein [Mycobacterium sp. MS1601]|uniref:hypothetical protein n=1 Tax=Mycobacterium sp. MS1601 TaxID=1936029 RepID=UPI00269CDEB2